MTGRLQGTLFGRPVELEATGREMLLQIADIRSAWRLRRSLRGGTLHLLHWLRTSGIALRVRIGSLATVNVLPRPGLALRVLAPALAQSGETVSLPTFRERR